MAPELNDAELERLLADRSDQLMRAAIALGGGRQAGEDLLQAALERVLRKKPRLVESDFEGYLRRVLYNLKILKAEGLIKAMTGDGTFVTERD